MIFIVTHKEDYTVDFLINKLNKRSISYYRYNTEDILTKNDISVHINNNNLNIKLPELEKITSVWFRRLKMPIIENVSESVRKYILDELKVFYNNLWELIDTKWVSIPKYIYSAENKFLQLKKASEVGLLIPNTLISSNKKEIVDFFHSNNENIIIKPIFNNDLYEDNCYKIIYTNEVTKERIDNLNEFMPLPSIYQNNIKKDIEIRATVINDKVFSAYVDSQLEIDSKTDWRKKKLKFYPYELPNEINKKCISLVKNMNLSFGAIDLIKDVNGDYIFLEINPNGQWAWIEMDTNIPISEYLINYLMIE